MPRPASSLSSRQPSASDAGVLHDTERQAALRRYAILDTPPEAAFDRIANVAAHLFDAQAALISFLGAHRQWFKACIGLEGNHVELDAHELGLEASFCAHAVRSQETLVVEDATDDARFAENPLVTGEPGVRFYAGAPLVAPSGQVLGTLCVLDPAARTGAAAPTTGQIEQLENLAAMVVDELELRREAAERKDAEAWQHLQARTMEQVARAVPLPDILEDLVDAVEARLPDVHASIVLYDADAGCLRHAAAPNLPDAYVEAIDGTAVGPDTGSCGAAVHRGDPVITEDIASDPRWKGFRDLARTHNLRACWSVPIEGSGDTVLGAFAVYSAAPARPADSDWALLRKVQALARLAIERHQDIEALRESEARMRGLANSVPGVIFQFYARSEGHYGLHFVGDQSASVLGMDAGPDDFITRFAARIPESHRDRFRASVDAAVRNGTDWSFEMPFEKSADETIWIQGLATPETRNGDTVWNGVLLDITRRKEAERNLNERKALLTSINNHITEGIYRSVPGEGLVYVNHAFVELFGYDSPEAMLALDDLSVLYATPEKRHDILQKARGEDLRDEEVRLRRADGSTFWGLLRTTAVQDPDGRVQHMDGAVMDITERKKVKEQLRRNRERWQRLVEAHRDPIQISIDGTVQYINPAGAELFGAGSPAEIIGRSVFDFATNDWATEAYEARIEQIQNGEPTSPMEHEIERLDGERRIIQTYSVPIEYDGQHAAQTVLRDVTGERKAEQALRESEAQLRGLANSVPGVIFQFYAHPPDAPGTDHWAYGLHFVSEQAAPVLGLDPAPDGFFERFVERVPKSHRAALMASVREAAHDGAAWSFEMPFEKPGGETIWVHGISTPEERETGRVWSGVLLDVTRRKQLESQLQHAQKMETVGTLAGGIAHDFNNILHATEAYLKMLEEGFPDDHPDRMLLDRALTGLGRASGLVQKLLTFSRQEGKTVEKAVDVAEVVAETIDLAEPSVPDHVRVQTEARTGCYVPGDPGQLQQVAMNLVTNAVQAMNDAPDSDAAADETAGNVLDTDVRRTTVGEDLAQQYLNLEPGPYVRLTVSDTGAGMNPETQDRVFEPFFTTKDVGEGTGLGLPVVHGIVQAHDGEVTMFTRPGQGTTFTVYLPALEREVEPDSERPAETNAGHILFVDDDEQVLELEAMRLGRMGYEVTTQNDADAALTALRERPDAYDLVITDYAMPGTNGLDLIKALRADGHAQPILLMSGFSASVSADDVRDAGAQAFLRKPVGTQELREALNQTLDSEAGA